MIYIENSLVKIRRYYESETVLPQVEESQLKKKSTVRSISKKSTQNPKTESSTSSYKQIKETGVGKDKSQEQ